MNDYKLPPCERETIIVFNDEEDNAIVYTCNKRIMAQIEKIMSNSIQDTHKIWSDEYSSKYSMPKKYIKIRKQNKKNLTEEQRKAIGERFKKYRENNTIGDAYDCD